jgi:hypothetical protein
MTDEETLDRILSTTTGVLQLHSDESAEGFSFLDHEVLQRMVWSVVVGPLSGLLLRELFEKVKKWKRPKDPLALSREELQTVVEQILAGLRSRDSEYALKIKEQIIIELRVTADEAGEITENLRHLVLLNTGSEPGERVGPGGPPAKSS